MSSIKLFESNQIRTVWNKVDQKWYFVVEDVVYVLTESKDPKQYIKRMRQRDKELAKGWVQFVPTLLLATSGGKQKMACANEGLYLKMIVQEN
jgi:prophage antirepressor-like protein